MNQALDVPAELTTPRLLLRMPRLEDAGALFRAYASDERVTPFMTWRRHRSEAETLAFLRSCLDAWSSGTRHSYVIEVGDGLSGPVGVIDLCNRGHRVDFGYVIARSVWGRGYMTEALSKLLDWSLDQPQVWRASAFCDVDNGASARVMEKAGMVFEGILRRYSIHPNLSDEPRDCRLFAKVRSVSKTGTGSGPPPQE
ncbi:MAG: GNAT family N-acetyltransferase [Kiloniellales bacterium]|nr:GNAT family N-acetyltransferase [Kiloniellales bacterium]